MMKLRFTFSLFSTLLATVLFVQLNHVAIMHWASTHTKTGIPCEAATTRAANAPEKCICCLIEQTDKSPQINVTPFIPLVRSGFALTADIAYSPSVTPRSNFSHTPLSTNRWLSTVVQRK